MMGTGLIAWEISRVSWETSVVNYLHPPLHSKVLSGCMNADDHIQQESRLPQNCHVIW